MSTTFVPLIGDCIVNNVCEQWLEWRADTISPTVLIQRIAMQGGAGPNCLCGLEAPSRTVTKPGPNEGRQFYGCSKPQDAGDRYGASDPGWQIRILYRLIKLWRVWGSMGTIRLMKVLKESRYATSFMSRLMLNGCSTLRERGLTLFYSLWQ